jgi:hypothetical protein
VAYNTAGGGALHIYANSLLSLSHSTPSNNMAWRDEGGASVQDGADIADSVFEGNSAGAQGGGLFNAGITYLTRVTIRYNAAPHSGGTARGNVASQGGGIYTSGSIGLLNSTLANNNALGVYAGIGGGISAIGNDSIMVIGFTTLVNNGVNGAVPAGAAIYRGGSLLLLKNSIIGSAPGACSGNVTSEGFNIATDGTCGLIQGTDRPSTDPMLSALALHGGPTLNAVPLLGSPALDADQCDDIAADQRGVSHP